MEAMSRYTIEIASKDTSIMSISLPTIVWLNSNPMNSNITFLVKLTESEHVQTFTEVDSCIGYINSHPEQPIFFIVSGSFASQIVPQVSESSNILMIFVFRASIKAQVGFGEKLLMFDLEEDLLQKLWFQFEEYLREQAKQCIKQADEYKERARRLKQSCG